jgi:GntR family transcriptional regulator/MocR family aminotransferase
MVGYYQPATGPGPLRATIAAHIGISRGVRCTPDEVILTAGTQGALDLAVLTLLVPGDQARLENPGYFGAEGALVASGAELISVPIDEQGIEVTEGRYRAPQAQLASILSPTSSRPGLR